MTIRNDEELARELASLTAWREATPGLWRRALDFEHAGTRTRIARTLARMLPLIGVAAAALVAIGISAFLIEPSLRTSRGPNAGAGGGVSYQHRSPPVTDSWSRVYDSASTPKQFITPSTSDTPDPSTATLRTFDSGVALSYSYQSRPSNGAAGAADLVQNSRSEVVGHDQNGPDPQRSARVTDAPGRHVVRKATIELATRDVRAAFVKAAHLTRDAGSEFVEDSSLTGAGRDAQANLTLRVAADRLSDVLNELRSLGAVRSERVEGQDVTTQVVDLDARLRNEQRVETELLQLLEKRHDAPLKEILEVRQSISAVRGEIEQIKAQREKLSRLVSLATVLVIIRAADAPEPAPQGLGAYFTDAMGSAWHKGLLVLADTAAALLAILIGGLVWWVLLVLALAVLWRRLRVRSHK